MARDSVIKKLISPDALFHRFADFFRGFFLICFALLAILGLTGTAYFSALVVVSDAPTIPAHTANTGFNAPQITEFEQFSDRLLQGQILWPQVVIPVDLAKVDLTDKERKAIQSGSALLESLLASRGVAKDEDRREKVARLIEHTHQRLSLQPGISDLSFATLFFDHVMEASLKPAFFPTNAAVAEAPAVEEAVMKNLPCWALTYCRLPRRWQADTRHSQCGADRTGSECQPLGPRHRQGS